MAGFSKEFTNDFSWSKSRHDLFSECQRKYYFNYYGSWNGWKYNADERTRKIYYLKKLQNRHMWIGSAVHLCIEKLLKNYRLENFETSLEELQASLLASLRQDFADSRSGNWAKKKWRLFEHEYDSDVDNQEWKRITDMAQLCLKNFWASAVHQTAKGLASDQWLEIEDFSHFFADEVKVHVVLDFSYRLGDQVFIFDWKTGQGASGIHALQLACYRIYAQKAWSADSKKINTVEFNLTRNEIKEYSEEGLSSEEALLTMSGSMAAMRELLDDVKGNAASEERFSFTEDSGKCRFCNFRAVCPNTVELS